MKSTKKLQITLILVKIRQKKVSITTKLLYDIDQYNSNITSKYIIDQKSQNYLKISARKLRITSKLPYVIDHKTENFFQMYTILWVKFG